MIRKSAIQIIEASVEDNRDIRKISHINKECWFTLYEEDCSRNWDNL